MSVGSRAEVMHGNADKTSGGLIVHLGEEPDTNIWIDRVGAF